MANILEEMPKIVRVGGGRKGSKYPLEEWFDGKVRELVQGEDFDCTAESLINSLHTRAAKQGLKVRTVKTDNGFALVAFVPETPLEDTSENGANSVDEPVLEADPDEE